MELFFDNILLETKQEDNGSSLVMLDNMKEKPNKGIIKCVGNGRPNEPMMYKEGDEVVYKNSHPVEVVLDGKKYLHIKQSDILFKL